MRPAPALSPELEAEALRCVAGWVPRSPAVRYSRTRGELAEDALWALSIAQGSVVVRLDDHRSEEG